jgi:general secretion pathway protein E
MLRRLLDDPTEGGEAGHAPSPIPALLEDAQRENVSDIHLDPVRDGYLLRFRRDGSLMEIALLDHDLGLHLLRSFKSQADLDPGFELRPQSGRARFSVAGKPVSVRVATAPGVHGEKLALRLPTLEAAGLTLNQLGLSPHDHESILSHIHDVRGMILVSGPTGAGKTTTLYALLKELQQSNRSIVSIEDPVEYAIDGVTQIQIHEKQGVTFAEGVTGLLRLDPDIVVVGEIRDHASARAALEVAQAGHACLSTLHARDAAATVSVLRNFGYADHDIASIVDLIVSQRLVRRLCESCRHQESTSAEEKQALIMWGQPVPSQCWHSVGCEDCSGSGYRGRLGVFEVHRLREEDADLIQAHADERTLRQHLKRYGGKSLLEDLLLKALEGTTSISEVQAVRGFGFYSH